MGRRSLELNDLDMVMLGMLTGQSTPRRYYCLPSSPAPLTWTWTRARSAPSTSRRRRWSGFPCDPPTVVPGKGLVVHFMQRQSDIARWDRLGPRVGAGTKHLALYGQPTLRSPAGSLDGSCLFRTHSPRALSTCC